MIAWRGGLDSFKKTMLETGRPQESFRSDAELAQMVAPLATTGIVPHRFRHKADTLLATLPRNLYIFATQNARASSTLVVTGRRPQPCQAHTNLLS